MLYSLLLMLSAIPDVIVLVHTYIHIYQAFLEFSLIHPRLRNNKFPLPAHNNNNNNLDEKLVDIEQSYRWLKSGDIKGET